MQTNLPKPVSIEREQNDVLVIEGVRYAGEFFRSMAAPEEGALYKIRRGDDGEVTITIVQHFDAKEIKNIRNCARCGKDHDVVKISRLSNPSDDFNYWGLCPVVHEPILVKIVSE